jgi:hypothetical protein
LDFRGVHPVQLDKTLIAIRERGLLETMDLALQVVRHHIGPLLLTSALGIVPMMLINQALLGWLMQSDYRDGWMYDDEGGTVARYLWDMTLLIAIEAPLASIFATSYLGKIVFVERPNIGEVFRDVLTLLPRVLWCQLIVRGVLGSWFLLLTLDRYAEFNVVVEFFLLGGLFAYSAVLRAIRPYVNEIVLLERNPLRSHGANGITVGLRSSQLHAPSSGDLMARTVATGMFSVLLTLSVVGTFVFLSGVFLNQWQPGAIMIAYVIPLSMWIVAGYMTVVRFLSYLDLRIRHEGWEVELRLRAEASRLLGQKN